MIIEPNAKNRKAALMKYAPHIEWDATGRKKVLATARCQGCGEEIRSDAVPENLQWVITKRGTAVFFHEKCFEQVWERKIAI